MIKNYLLLILCVFFPLKSFGENLKWFDLEKFERYQLKQELKIADGLEFKVGDKFDFLDQLGGGIPAVYFQMHYVDCKNPNLTSEAILINPEPEDLKRDRSVIVTLEEGCNLGIWVESQDMFSSSLFKEDR